MSPIELEIVYQKYMGNLASFVPDGILDVDLDLLQQLGLVQEPMELSQEDNMGYNFYVVESSDKLTLFNSKFIVWIVPQLIDKVPVTYGLIASNHEKDTHLEMVFSAKGVYNHSNLVLRVLEKLLEQIEDNEKELYFY
ncbi:hypothetical protein [Candidatus Clavichlamydia salmonicola]|uniref:hypothetical protein n=1 Tax=Candidatus Clavichlamydia salmonicola TaxID=469812 RepID=UPI0018915F9C|nr:hypothetical protein [Candidatus Clavichlamydia salmonicola]